MIFVLSMRDGSSTYINHSPIGCRHTLKCSNFSCYDGLRLFNGEMKYCDIQYLNPISAHLSHFSRYFLSINSFIVSHMDFTRFRSEKKAGQLIQIVALGLVFLRMASPYSKEHHLKLMRGQAFAETLDRLRIVVSGSKLMSIDY